MFLLSRYISKQLSSYQNELIQTHYAEVENMYRQVRGWRHDYRNHIQVLKSYAKEGDLEALQNYLDALDQDLSAVDNCRCPCSGRTENFGNRLMYHYRKFIRQCD